MGTRILPVYSGWTLYRGRFNESVVVLLLVGSLLRVVAELIGGYAAPTGSIAALGGSLAALGFTLFAVALWPTIAPASRNLSASPYAPIGKRAP
jgi:hypothetical protein